LRPLRQWSGRGELYNWSGELVAAAELKVASFTSALGNACRAPHSQPHHATVLDTVDVPAPDRCQSYTCDKPFLGCFAVHHSPAFMAHQRSLCGTSIILSNQARAIALQLPENALLIYTECIHSYLRRTREWNDVPKARCSFAAPRAQLRILPLLWIQYLGGEF
jgi:hypothetical protein